MLGGNGCWELTCSPVSQFLGALFSGPFSEFHVALWRICRLIFSCLTVKAQWFPATCHHWVTFVILPKVHGFPVVWLSAVFSFHTLYSFSTSQSVVAVWSFHIQSVTLGEHPLFWEWGDSCKSLCLLELPQGQAGDTHTMKSVMTAADAKGPHRGQEGQGELPPTGSDLQHWWVTQMRQVSAWGWDPVMRNSQCKGQVQRVRGLLMNGETKASRWFWGSCRMEGIFTFTDTC